MAITTTGSFIQAHVAGNSSATFTVANAGDLCVVAISVDSVTILPTGASGTNSMGPFNSGAVLSDSSLATAIRLFWATAGAAGSSVVTITWSSALGTTGTQFDGWMFTAGLGAGTVWTTDTSNTRTSTGTGAGSMLFPSLTAAGSGELYVGCGVATGTGAAGSTSGFSYSVDTGFSNVFAYNLNASGTLAPTAADGSSGDKITVAALLKASSGGLSSLLNPPASNRARLIRTSCF